MAGNMKNIKNLVKIPQANYKLLFGLAVGGAGVLYGANNCYYTVKGGHRAIIFNRFGGVRKKVYAEGLHFKVPWMDIPVHFNIRAQVRPYSTTTGSKDLQMVNITLRVLSRPNVNRLPEIYVRLGQDYKEVILPSVANEVLKSVVAQFTAAELITMREFVSQQIKAKMIARSREFGLELDDVSITHLTFGREYAAAIEAKQVAQQEAERAKFIVERAMQTKLEIIAKAEGEARAAIAFNEQLMNDPDGNFLKLRRIEAAKEIAQIVSAGQNKIIIDSANLLFTQLFTETDNTLIDGLVNVQAQ
mmetsp:Transcript_1868/g.6663  ORF Transcript_1868/g.6663 Transcript_1868/m.6663 type:complete len:303 (+) Transcript_1868:60-968(+)